MSIYVAALRMGFLVDPPPRMLKSGETIGFKFSGWPAEIFIMCVVGKSRGGAIFLKKIVFKTSFILGICG